MSAQAQTPLSLHQQKTTPNSRIYPSPPTSHNTSSDSDDEDLDKVFEEADRHSKELREKWNSKEYLQRQLEEQEELSKSTTGFISEEEKQRYRKDALETRQKLAKILQDELNAELQRNIASLEAGILEVRDDKKGIVKQKLTKEEAERLKAERIEDNQKMKSEIKALAEQDNPAQHDFCSGFSVALIGNHNAALQVINGTFKPDLSNPIEKFATLAHFLPFGGSAVAQAIKSASRVVVSYNMQKSMKKLCDAFHPNLANDTIGHLSIKLTHELKSQIEAAKPVVTTNFDKYMVALTKLFGGGVNNFYDTPAKFAGFAYATKLTKAIENGELVTQPIKGFADRMDAWINENFLGQNGEQALTELGGEFDSILGAIAVKGGCVVM